MSETKRCDKNGMCQFLEERLTDGGKGFHAIHTINMDPTTESPRMQWRGVSYHERAKDRGLLINFCPWCGGKPGDMANRDTPNATAEARVSRRLGPDVGSSESKGGEA